MVLDHADPAGQHADLQDTVASLEHAVVETILDGRPMEGITCPELLDHLLRLLDTTLDAGLVEKISDWEPAASPVPDTRLDGRLMEGTTYLEHSVMGVSLESGLMAGMSSLEPLEQSVLNTLLVARPCEEITEKISDWEPVAHPVQDTTLDGRLMEGTTNLEHSVLGGGGGSLDSGLMAGMSSLEPLEQSVLNTLLVARPAEVITEMDTPERSALASQLDYGQSILDINQDGNTEMDTDPSERSALATHVDFGLLHVESVSRLSSVHVSYIPYVSYMFKNMLEIT